MNFKVKGETLINSFTLVGLLFFTSYIGFIYNITSQDVDNGLLSDTAGSPLNKIVGTFIFLVCAFYAVRSKLIFSVEYIKDNIFVLLFCFYVILTIFWSVEPYVSFRRVIFFLTVFTFSCYLTRYYKIDVIFLFIGYIITFCAITGLIRAVFFPENAFVSGGIREGAFLGIFVEKNGGARAYALAITLMLPQILLGNRKAVISSFVCLFCLLLARSASGIILLLLNVITICYLNSLIDKSKSYHNRVRYILGLLLYIFILYCTYLLSDYILALFDRDATLTNRTVIWDLIIPLVFDKINFGYGYGAFWASTSAGEFLDSWGYIGNAHNGYLEMLLHGGIPMLVIFFIMTISAIIKIILKAVNDENYKEYNVCVAIIVQMLITNAIAYSLPNHNSLDFFIFSLILFLANSISGRLEKD